MQMIKNAETLGGVCTQVIANNKKIIYKNKKSKLNKPIKKAPEKSANFIGLIRFAFFAFFKQANLLPIYPKNRRKKHEFKKIHKKQRYNLNSARSNNDILLWRIYKI